MPLKLPLFCLILFFVTSEASLLPQLNGFYTDILTLGSTSGSPYTSTASGYNFTRSWRESLPKIITSGLCLYNFKVAANTMLTFEAEIVNTTASGLTINMKPTTADVGIMYLAFSAIVVTEDNNYLELLTFTQPSITSSSYYISSSKFFFEPSNTPHMVYFFQWITAYDIPNTKIYDNYWAYLYVYFVTSSANLRITYTKDATYLKGMRINILLTNKAHSQKYQKISKTGDSISKSFDYNFGIDTSQYGQSVGGTHCLSGLYVIDLYFYRNTTYTQTPSFLFTMSGTQVADIPFAMAYAVKLDTVCFNYGKTIEQSESNGVITMAAILGGAIGGSLLIALICCIIVKCCWMRRIHNENDQPSMRASTIIQVRPQQLSSHEWVKKQYIDLTFQECSICLSPQVNVLTACGHYFHTWCLTSWSIKMDSCPNCRQHLRQVHHQLICSRCSVNTLEMDFRNIGEYRRIQDAQKIVCSTCKSGTKNIYDL